MKLHLPLPLRSALLAVCSLFTVNQTFASTTLTSDIVATEADAGQSVMISTSYNGLTYRYLDRAMYGPAWEEWENSQRHWIRFEGTLRGLQDLDGDNRTYSYTLNLHQQCAWVMSGRNLMFSDLMPSEDVPTYLTFTRMNDVSVIGSCQLVPDGDGYRQMKGYSAHTPQGLDSVLMLTITDSNSFTFAEARGGSKRGTLTTKGSITLDGVDHITIRDNMEGDVIYAGSLSVSNAQSFSYTGNAVHLAHTATSITLSNIENASFTDNSEAIFYEFRNSDSDQNYFDIHFANIANLTFSGNRTEEDCLFASGAGYGVSNRLIYFNGCGVVKIVNNRTEKGSLFRNKALYDSMVPVFQNCGTVEICDNTALEGLVIGKGIILSGTTEAIRINNNKMGDYSLVSYMNIDGSEEAWTPLLEMKGNTANDSGSFSGLVSGLSSISNIEKIDLSGNHIQAIGGIGILGSFEVNNIGEIIIEKNEGHATGGVALDGAGYIRQFEKLTIQNNTLNSKQGGIGLFSGSIDLVGRDDMSSVVLIQGNTGETESTSGFGGATITIKNLKEFCYTDNNFTSTLSRLGCGKVSNVNRFLITNNKTQFDGSIAQSEIQRGGIFSEGFKADSINEFVVSGNIFLTPAKASGGVFEFDYISYNTVTSMSNIGNFRAENNIIAAKINEDGSVEYAEKAAGAVLSDLSCENGNFLFASNAVYGNLAALGGAVGNLESIAPFSLSGSLTLEDNHAYGGWETESVAKGGALYCRLNIHGGDKLYASGNSAEATCASGGAMYIVDNSVENTFAVDEMILQNNRAIGTTSAWGGAVYVQASVSLSPYLPVTPQEIGSLVIRDNYAQASSLENAKGGAIYLKWLDDAGYAFANTDSIYIRGNYITDGSRTQLQSIYSGARILINMQQGQTFECYDGIYSTSNIWVNGGDNYIPQWSEVQYKGTVTFSGKYAQQDLSALKLRFTDEDLQASRTIHAHSVYLTDGTLKLDHVRVETGSHDYTLDVKQENASFRVTSNQAKLEMNNTTIATRAIFIAIPEEVVTHGLVLLGNTTFTGSNRIEAGCLWTIGNNTWTFNLNSSNQETAVLSLDFDPQIDDNQLYTPNLNIAVQHGATLVKGEYKLLEWNDSYGDWLKPNGSYLTFSAPDGTPLTLGGDVYLQSTDTPEGTLCTLMYHYGAGPDIPAQRDPAVLTWNGIDSLWSAESGADAGCWSGEAEDLNFYNGDSVVFQGGEVEIEGLVKPGSVIVEGDADTIFRGEGSITGATSIVKNGDGTLEFRNTNSYTGGTVLNGGTLVASADGALGNGAVTLNGGTLDAGGHAVGNDIVVTGEASINQASAYAGILRLDGGTLGGGEVNLAQDAELLSGSITNALTGSAGVTKSGSGEVTLGGSSNYTGATTVQAGTLTVSGSLTQSDVTVAEGASLVVAEGGALGGDITLQQGSVAHLGTLELVKQELTLEGATLTADCLTLGEGATLTATAEQTIGGTLKLAGGTLALETGKALSIATLETEANTVTSLIVDAAGLHDGDNLLFNYGNAAGADWDALTIQGTEGMRAELSNRTSGDGSGSLVLTKTEASLIWAGQSGTWTEAQGDASLWTSDNGSVNDTHFYNGDSVSFAAGTHDVEIQGEVIPRTVTVTAGSHTTFNGPGSIAGESVVNVSGADSLLRVETANTYTGGTMVSNGGMLEIANDRALGSGSVTLENAMADFNGHRVANTVTAKGENVLAGASGLTRLVLSENSTTHVRGEGGYVLGVGQTLVAGLNTQLSEAGRSASPILTLAGGTLVLQGKGFAVNGATSILNSATTVLDLSGISTEGLTPGGSIELCKLGTALEGDLANLQVTGLTDTLLKRASLSLADDGTLLLTLAKPAKNDVLAAQLNRNQGRVYDVLCSLAETGEAEGELAEIADAAAVQEDLSSLKTLLDSVSCPELAGMMSSQIEGNLSHLRRLRAAMGKGAVSGTEKSSALTAYVQAFNSDSNMDEDTSGSGYRRNEWGVLFGLETPATENLTVGCAIEGSRAKISPTGAARYHEERQTADLYATYRVGALSGCTSIGMGIHDYSMPSGQRNRAPRNIEGSSFNFSQEFAYAVAMGDRMSLQPFFCIDSSVNDIDSYRVGNGGTAALMVDGQQTWATELTLGLRYNTQFAAVSSAPSAFFSAQIGAVCDVGDTTDDLRVHFAGAADKGFLISSADRRRHGFSAGMNLTVPVSESTAIFGSVETTQRGDSDSYHAQLGLRVSF